MHHDEAVTLLRELDRGFVGLSHAPLAFVGERHRSEREHGRARVGREAGDHRGGAAAGTTTKAGHEHHERDAGEKATERGFFRFRRSLAERSFATRTHPARLRAAELQGAPAAGRQRTGIGVE